MIFRQLFDQDSWTYTYLLADEGSREAVLVDSVDTQVERDLHLLDELGLILKYCLETHVHADHVTGAHKLREHTGCQTAVSTHAQVECADIHLSDGDVIKIGGIEIKALETPGHTNTCLSYHTHNMVFTGDALLIRGCGRTDFQSGNPGQLYDSIIQKLFTLAEGTLVFPGHDYRGFSMSTIGEEKRYNPRLALDREAFIEHMNSLVLDNPRKMDLAVPANRHCGKAVE
jgi:glyoxylase-like metal-dependent hydrolase (beta-lactamase superfamily II)